MEYAAAIWDTTIDKDGDKLEWVQRRAARWARGQYGIVSVDALLKELGWAELSQRRRRQRLVLVYKIIQDLIAIPPESVDIALNSRPPRKRHSRQISRFRAGDQWSPVWKGTVARSVPEWNKLSPPCAEAETLDSFKAQLERAFP